MKFYRSLNRIRRWQRLGRFLAAILTTLALAAALALILGLADARLALETSARTSWVTTLATLAALLGLAALTTAFIFSYHRSAKMADQLSQSSRGPATAGLALSNHPQDTPLTQFLTQRSLDDAARQLAAIPVSRIIPWRTIGLALAALILAILPIAILALAHPKATSTIAHRLTHPATDLPPWSPLNFSLDPTSPTALYGHDLTVSASITGAPLEHPIECLVRRPDSSKIERLPAFRESKSRFSRTLESVTEPISIAFACGRARSAWYPVELLLQPRVVSGQVTITPPTHTGRPTTTSPLDSGEIRAIQGSLIQLDLTSNRPLAPSTLIFSPVASPGQEATPHEISGTLAQSNTVRFEFTASRPGELAATLIDVRGTRASDPLVVKLRAIPDAAPVVNLLSPPSLLLATPDTNVSLNGRAEDDHALSRIRLVRTLQGFRDRARIIAPALDSPRFEFEDSLNLPELGVQPGQTLELFLEASDHNPSLLGQGASALSRIHIISHEQYAAHIRSKTTLEQFNQRFRSLFNEIDKAREALDALERAGNNPEQLEAAKQQAIEAQRQAAEMLDQLAKDFPAFDLENRLKELAAEHASALRQNISDLKNFDPKASPEDRQKALDAMRDRLGQKQPELDQLQQDAKLAAEAGKILEMAAKFQAIYKNQQSIAQRIQTIAREIHRGNDANRRQLPSLARTQEKNRKALDDFTAELKRRAESVKSPDLKPLRDSALEFQRALELADPGSVMDLAAESAKLGESNDAYVSAEMARAQLERFLQQPNPFSQACQGQCNGFSVPNPDLNNTLQQLLEGLMGQNPGSSPNQNSGGGGGFGLGGFGPTGNAQPGFSTADVPVVGPQRTEFEPASLDASSKGGDSNQNNRGAIADQAAESESLQPTESPRTSQAAPDLENVPDAYREAVQKYFTPDQ